jgi:Family of unknown function (DUF6064)
MNAGLPFTRDQFLGMFEAYNHAIWPTQLVACLVGFGAVGLVVWHRRESDRVIAGVLAPLWLWLGLAFHWTLLRRIDSGPAPVVVAAAFVLESGLFTVLGVLRHELRFEVKASPSSVAAGVLIGHALLVYSLLGTLTGHGDPRQPLFGVAPRPTTIFTFGLLLLTASRVPKCLLVVPFLWSVTSGASATLNYGVYEEVGSWSPVLLPRACSSHATGAGPADLRFMRRPASYE